VSAEMHLHWRQNGEVTKSPTYPHRSSICKCSRSQAHNTGDNSGSSVRALWLKADQGASTGVHRYCARHQGGPSSFCPDKLQAVGYRTAPGGCSGGHW
jgi:hypothetical protein